MLQEFQRLYIELIGDTRTTTKETKTAIWCPPVTKKQHYMTSVVQTMTPWDYCMTPQDCHWASHH